MAKKHSRNIWKWRIISGSDQSLCSFVCAGVCMEFRWIMCLYIRPALTWCVCVRIMNLCLIFSAKGVTLCLLLKISRQHDCVFLLAPVDWDSENGSETVQLLQDGPETPGEEATNGRLRVASPSTGPATHSRHKFPYASRESRQETQWFVISGSLAALWSRLLPAPEKKFWWLSLAPA